jgi:hypothetical protein
LKTLRLRIASVLDQLPSRSVHESFSRLEDVRQRQGDGGSVDEVVQPSDMPPDKHRGEQLRRDARLRADIGRLGNGPPRTIAVTRLRTGNTPSTLRLPQCPSSSFASRGATAISRITPAIRLAHPTIGRRMNCHRSLQFGAHAPTE